MSASEMPKVDDLAQTDGGSIRLAQNFLTGSARLVVGNAQTLTDHLALVLDPPIPDRNAYLDEAERHTFNFLMSSLALRDLSYRVLKVPLIAASDFPAANTEQVRVFSDDLRLALVGELRDHVAHRGLPPLTIVTEATGTSFSQWVVLVRGPLTRDEKIPTRVRDFVDSHDQEIAFAPLITEYVEAQWAWFRWFQRELSRRFAPQLQELDAALAPWSHVSPSTPPRSATT